MAITNRKLFFKGLKLRDTQWPFTGKVPEVDYSENLEKITAYDKLRIATIQKRTSKSVVMSGTTYLYMTRLQKMGSKFMTKVAQICLRINGQLCEVKSTIHTRSFNLGSLRCVENEA